MRAPLSPAPHAVQNRATLPQLRDEADVVLECCAVCGCPGGPCTIPGGSRTTRLALVRCPFGRSHATRER